MKAPLFDDILNVSQAIADASAKDDDTAREIHYQTLIKLCATNEDTPRDHPLQWEALADFTLDADQAIDIYQKGLDCANKLDLNNAKASIYLSMAQRYKEIDDDSNALDSINQANALIEVITIEELKSEIIEFLNALNQQ